MYDNKGLVQSLENGGLVMSRKWQTLAERIGLVH